MDRVHKGRKLIHSPEILGLEDHPSDAEPLDQPLEVAPVPPPLEAHDQHLGDLPSNVRLARGGRSRCKEAGDGEGGA